MHKANTTYRGITASVEIRDYEEPGHVEILVHIDPPGQGLDVLAYTRVQRTPGVPPPAARPCRRTLNGGEAACNGGGYDGCACGPYTVADYRAMARLERRTW